jgi:hypothetical protein
MEGPLATRRLLASGDADRVRDAVGALAVPHDVLVERGPPTIAGLVNGARLRRMSVVYVRYGARVRVEAPATEARLALTVPLGPMRVATGGTASARCTRRASCSTPSARRSCTRRPGSARSS